MFWQSGNCGVCEMSPTARWQQWGVLQDVAEQLFLRYLQRWGKDFLRRRLDWMLDEEGGTPAGPRHLSQALCPCQYSEEILRNKEPRDARACCPPCDHWLRRRGVHWLLSGGKFLCTGMRPPLCYGPPITAACICCTGAGSAALSAVRGSLGLAGGQAPVGGERAGARPTFRALAVSLPIRPATSHHQTTARSGQILHSPRPTRSSNGRAHCLNPSTINVLTILF